MPSRSLSDEQLRLKWNTLQPEELAKLAESIDDEYLVDGWVPAKKITLMLGDTGLGKTPLAYHLGLAIASGTPIFSRPVKMGRVLYLDGENGILRANDMVRNISAHLGLPEPPKNFELISFDYMAPGWGPEKLELLIADHMPELVIVDTMSTWWGHIEEKNVSAATQYQLLRKIINRCGCGVLVIHHTRKPIENPNALRPLDSIRLTQENSRQWFKLSRGASALVNNADMRLGVDLPSEDSLFDKDTAIVVGGYERVVGDIPLVSLVKVFDDASGDPTGYKLGTSLDLLSPQLAEFARALPMEFSFTEAMKIYGRQNNPTAQALQALVSAGILQPHSARMPWKKI